VAARSRSDATSMANLPLANRSGFGSGPASQCLLSHRHGLDHPDRQSRRVRTLGRPRSQRPSTHNSAIVAAIARILDRSHSSLRSSSNLSEHSWSCRVTLDSA
jgi:hypothetical protein